MTVREARLQRRIDAPPEVDYGLQLAAAAVALDKPARPAQARTRRG